MNHSKKLYQPNIKIWMQIKLGFMSIIKAISALNLGDNPIW